MPDHPRDRWMLQQQDETEALRTQQATAGTSHAPVVGPAPYGDHGVNMLVETAVRNERERCIAIVERWATDHGRSSLAQPSEKHAFLTRLAAALRSD
jgi:hypothetical protein